MRHSLLTRLPQKFGVNPPFKPLRYELIFLATALQVFIVLFVQISTSPPILDGADSTLRLVVIQPPPLLPGDIYGL